MNYFELYGIPVSLKVDGAVAKSKYYALSRAFHPDFHSQSDAAKQEEILQKSADINRAYTVFQSEDDTIRYVLMMKGLMVEEEKYALKPDFFNGGDGDQRAVDGTGNGGRQKPA